METTIEVTPEVTGFTEFAVDVTQKLTDIHALLFFSITIAAAIFVIYLIFKPLLIMVEEI